MVSQPGGWQLRYGRGGQQNNVFLVRTLRMVGSHSAEKHNPGKKGLGTGGGYT